jgi:hypothetical protein
MKLIAKLLELVRYRPENPNAINERALWEAKSFLAQAELIIEQNEALIIGYRKTIARLEASV